MVNRSQHDINTNRDMKDAIAAEAAFFDARCACCLLCLALSLVMHSCLSTRWGTAKLGTQLRASTALPVMKVT